MEIKDILLISKLFEVIIEKNIEKSYMEHMKKKAVSNSNKKHLNGVLVNMEDIKNYIISKTEFKKTTKFFFEVMDRYKFINYSSVNSVFDVHIKNTLGTYDYVKEIDLYSHTLDVMYEAIIIAETKNMPLSKLSISLLIAQLHDFGKCPEIEKKYKLQDHNSHADISAEFAESVFFDKRNRKIFSELGKDIIQTVIEAVKNHHTNVSNSNWIVEIQKADTMARQKEFRYIKRKIRGH